jgi:hypothetical protein
MVGLFIAVIALTLGLVRAGTCSCCRPALDTDNASPDGHGRLGVVEGGALVDLLLQLSSCAKTTRFCEVTRRGAW